MENEQFEISSLAHFFFEQNASEIKSFFRFKTTL